MNANEFTWFQRGKIDCIIGVPFSSSPAPDLFEREEWEKGYMEAADDSAKLVLRVASASRRPLLAQLPRTA